MSVRSSSGSSSGLGVMGTERSTMRIGPLSISFEIWKPDRALELRDRADAPKLESTRQRQGGRMKRRWMVVGLALVAAVGIAVPASGQGSTLLRALGLAQRADQQSQSARRLALNAVHRARVAQEDALTAVR